MKFDMPTPTADVDANGNFDRGWVAWITRVTNAIVGRSQAGTTAQRPVSGKGLEIGLPYFDTTLSRPIWCSQVTPAVVWIRADGVVV